MHSSRVIPFNAHVAQIGRNVIANLITLKIPPDPVAWLPNLYLLVR